MSNPNFLVVLSSLGHSRGSSPWIAEKFPWPWNSSGWADLWTSKLSAGAEYLLSWHHWETAKTPLSVSFGQLQSELCCTAWQWVQAGPATPASKAEMSLKLGKVNGFFRRYKNNWRMQTASGVVEGAKRYFVRYLNWECKKYPRSAPVSNSLPGLDSRDVVCVCWPILPTGPTST